MNESNCSVCSLHFPHAHTLYSVLPGRCLSKGFNTGELAYWKGNRTDVHTVPCSPPALDLILTHCLELPRSTPSLSLAQAGKFWAAESPWGLAQGTGKVGRWQRQRLQRWPQFLSFLSHGVPQSQTLSFFQQEQTKMTTFPGIFTQLSSPAAPCCVAEYSDSAH